MVARFFSFLALAFVLSFFGAAKANAEGVLDGLVFSGMIGPAQNPDLADSLYFDEGRFWSDICTQCGFAPGTYDAAETADGIRFSGTLESDSRGRFDYDGLVQDDGTIQVSITWERRRWYWTSRREIAFVGALSTQRKVASLADVIQAMQSLDPEGNPLCARF